MSYESDVAEFKNRFRDGVTEQKFVIRFDDGLILDSGAGDIILDSVDIDQYYCTDVDYSFGNTPSDSVRCTLYNKDGRFSNYNFGDAECFICAKKSDIPIERQASWTACVKTENGDYYYSTSSGVFFYDYEDLQMSPHACKSFIVQRDRIYSYNGKGDSKVSKVVSYGVFDVQDWDVPDEMIPLLERNVGICFDKKSYNSYPQGLSFPYTDFCFCEGNVTNIYTYANGIGVTFDKPINANTSQLEIEGVGHMSKFDEDAYGCLSLISSYPITLASLITRICEYVGFTVEFDSLSGIYNVSVQKNPFSIGQYSLRDVVGFIAEYCSASARFSDYKKLNIKSLSTSSVSENVGISSIAFGSVSLLNYTTEPIRNVLIKNVNGSTQEYSISETGGYYYVMGNPFMSELNDYQRQRFENFPTFSPVTFTVVNAYPSTDMGSMVSAEILDEFSETPITCTFPLMHKSIHWNGRCTAEYSATGNKKRELLSTQDQTYYNAQVGTDAASKLGYSVGYDNYSTDLLSIDFVNPLAEINKPSAIATENATTLVNSPVSSGAFYAYREVLTIKAPIQQNLKVVVRLTEAFPQGGRIWTNAYNPDSSTWSGWTSH